MSDFRRTTFHKSLTQIKTIAGVESRLFLGNATITVALVQALANVWFVIFGFILHAFFYWLTKKEPLIIKIYGRFNRQGDRYDPWPRSNQRFNQRPRGFGRGMLR